MPAVKMQLPPLTWQACPMLRGQGVASFRVGLNVESFTTMGGVPVGRGMSWLSRREFKKSSVLGVKKSHVLGLKRASVCFPEAFPMVRGKDVAAANLGVGRFCGSV